MAGSRKASLSVVIPLHDEAAGVPALAQRMHAFVAAESALRDVELVLVDDGSTDGTHALLREHFGSAQTVLRHPQNQGLAAALATGSAAARGELIAWLDGDLTYDPAVLSDLAAAADRGADVAVASCHHPSGAIEGVAAWRRWLSQLASRIYRRLTRSPLHTFTCMVRVQQRRVLDACPPRHAGFVGVTASLLDAMRAGYRVAEVPATLRRRGHGRSKMRFVRVGLAHLWLMGRLLTRSRL